MSSGPPPVNGTSARGWRGLLELVHRGGRPLLGLLLTGALFKLVVMSAALSGDPLLLQPTSDSRWYLDRAQDLLSGAPRDEVHHLPPLYPRLLSLVPGAVEGRLGLLLAFQHGAGLLLVLLTYLWVARRTPASHRPWGALVAATLVLAYGPLTYYETRVLGDSLATLLLMLGLAVAECLPPRRDPSSAGAGADGVARGLVFAGGLGLGLLLGAACLLRPQALLFAVLLLPWVLRRRVGAGLVAATTLGACLLPSALHNLRAGGDLVLISDNGGINLYLAASGPPSGTFLVDDEAFGSIERQAGESRRRAEAEAGGPLTPGQVSRHWTSRALELALADPAAALRRVGLRALALLEDFETDVVAFPELAAEAAAPLALAALPFALLLAGAGAAATLTWRARRAPAHGPSAWPATALLLTVTVTALAFFHYSRFRLPAVPLLAGAIGVAIERCRLAPPTRGRAGAALLVAALLAWVSLRPAGHHRLTLANGWTSRAEARLAGNDPERIEVARAELERALEIDPRMPRALMGLAEVDLERQAYDACALSLISLERRFPDHPRTLAVGAQLALLPHPANAQRDVERGRELTERVRAAVASHPELASLVPRLEALLAAAAAPR